MKHQESPKSLYLRINFSSHQNLKYGLSVKFQFLVRIHNMHLPSPSVNLHSMNLVQEIVHHCQIPCFHGEPQLQAFKCALFLANMGILHFWHTYFLHFSSYTGRTVLMVSNHTTRDKVREARERDESKG